MSYIHYLIMQSLVNRFFTNNSAHVWCRDTRGEKDEEYILNFIHGCMEDYDDPSDVEDDDGNRLFTPDEFATLTDYVLKKVEG